eukprot:GHVR01140151.1.p1 GENE.GHVR01140151.1~~GHVR01140151.1.p1  ORF type:complete len:394 (+),score=101.13 GHVR01140151.1:57-1238(+)
MGIKGLMKFISDHAPRAIKKVELGSYTGRKLAIDASMSLYQFMIAIREGEGHANLTNEQGETTSHIAGFVNRVIRFLEEGIKPVYVFDGSACQLKSGELLKRSNRRKKAEDDLEIAKEEGDDHDIKKFTARTVKVTRQHNDDIKQLLNLMGVPVVQAPGDAEATCAALARQGVVYATATDDADALTFGTPKQVRHMNLSEQKLRGNPILEVDLSILLNDLNLTQSQFIDMCILFGCDYCDTIKGVGPERAYKLMTECGSMEGVIKKLSSAYPLPDNFNYKAVHELFTDPPVAESSESDLVCGDFDAEGLRAFLVDKHSFNPKRVETITEKLKKAKQKSSQTRLDNFFGNVEVKYNEKKIKKQQEDHMRLLKENKAKKRKAAAAAQGHTAKKNK